MKMLAVFIVFLAVLISVVPQFTDCESQGRALTLQDGRQIPMKCHWTARAELVAGIPLFAVGVLLFTSHSKETKNRLSILGLILGAFVILLPTGLIGVCLSADMLCNSIMKPFLILMGSLVVAISLAVLAFSIQSGKIDPPAQVKPD